MHAKLEEIASDDHPFKRGTRRIAVNMAFRDPAAPALDPRDFYPRWYLDLRYNFAHPRMKALTTMSVLSVGVVMWTFVYSVYQITSMGPSNVTPHLNETCGAI